MGLFSSKTKTQVATQFQRVLEDNTIPDSVLNGVTKNLFDAEGGGDQVVEYIMEELVSSIGVRAGRMYEYGKKDYIFGLPQSSYHSSFAGKGAVQTALSQQYGGQVGLSYYHFGPLNTLHAGWQKLVDVYGYDARTNQMAYNGKTVFLKDMQAVVVDASAEEQVNGALEAWGPTANSGAMPNRLDFATTAKATPYAVDPAASNDYVRVTVSHEEQYNEVVEGVTVTKKRIVDEVFTVAITGYDLEADYHQARFSTGAGQVGYWTYKAGSGQYPTVDAVYAAGWTGNGGFFPFGYFRYNKKSTVDDPNSAEFKSSKKLMNYLNMDFETLGKGINENPDIKDVEQAMLMMMVPAKTTNPLEQRYLFDFFGNIVVSTKDFGNTHDFIEAMGMKIQIDGGIASTSMIIQDKRFKMALAFQSIVKKRVGGKIGKVGAYASGNNDREHWYQHQISDAVYEEVRVVGLKMTFWVFEGYTTVGDGSDEILMIPLDMNIALNYSLPDREVLYCRALHYMFNSRVVTKVKWYQSGIFRAIMIIAAIVITVISVGQTWQAVAAAVAAGATTAAIVAMIAMSVLKYLLVKVAVTLFVKVVGVKIAFIAAIIAAMYGIYKVIDVGSLSGAPWAKEMLQLSTGLSSAVSKQLGVEVNDLLEEQSEFQKFVSDQTKLLDDAKALLDGNVRLDPFIIFGESPNDFYQRTVHSGNIGVLGIEAVSNYVDIALQLPKISQTIGAEV